MNPLPEHHFTPQQSAAFQSILNCLQFHPRVLLTAGDGMGRTALIEALHARLGGTLLTIRDYIEATAGKHPLGTDEWLYDLLVKHLGESDTLLVDDFHLAADVPSHCYHPRQNYFEAAMEAVGRFAERSGRRLIIASDGTFADGLEKRAFSFSIGAFGEADFAAIGRNVFGDSAEQIDWSRIHRFVPHLTARDLTLAGRWLVSSGAPVDTDRLFEYLTERHLTSNVRRSEVEEVDLPDLIGVDDVIARLEENIVFPMSDDPLVRELQLQPKRGVLLAGPPGTGKTSIGRALAHRLGGKFFLVDGTAISGTEYFYHHVDRIFRMAVRNAPAVIFIDDSDVIFESGREHGLYRYLLTKLDGLESKSAGRVCVMLTAMDVGNIPPALVRSGRIELWLEMRLPDAAARETILRRAMAGTDLFDGVDLTQVVARSEEFSGADLKRLVLDAKIRYAAEVQGDRTPPPAETLLCDAADVIRRNRLTYSEAEAKAKARRPDRPLWFSPMSDFHQVVAE